MKLASSLLWIGVTSVLNVATLCQFQLEPLWTLAPGDRPYLTTDNTQRGMDYNPVTGHLLLVNRAGGLSIAILDASTGAHVGFMDLGTGIITGGTFAANMIGVADDGAVYVVNLTLNSTTTPFKLYRWESETSTPTVAFEGDPSQNIPIGGNNSKRFGDTFDVRGAGTTTQILMAARGGGDAAVLVTGNGLNFVGYGIATDAGASASDNSSNIGLGIAFGQGNSFWGTALGRTLRHINVNTGVLPFSGTTVGNFTADNGVPTAITLIGVEPMLGLLAGVELVTGPDKVHLFDISSGTPVLLDSETLTVDNANANGVGSVAFGGNKLFVLDCNNGIHAYQIVPEPSTIGLIGLGLAALCYFRLRKRSST
ncbi:MAG: DUF4623 domain-containing protein [Verrucomicrobiae bacterium]|nr:DUF4623 domain-containing protein [Verrucomicrobiae bacterium]